MTICRQLLQSPRLDENRFGLESLVMLTNPTKVLARDAMQVSQRVLTDFDFQHGLLEQYFVHVNNNNNIGVATIGLATMMTTRTMILSVK
jgi:hypothetical protein